MSEENANSANSAENTDANLRIMQGGHSAGHWFHRYLAAQDRYEITLRRLREAEAERDALREALAYLLDGHIGTVKAHTPNFDPEYEHVVQVARAALAGDNLFLSQDERAALQNHVKQEGGAR